uniref:Uncharacterized protein n=1 Tax=Brassica oleracea var. oleracea TaxID=109376 RepID=A0A0D3DKW1_BRAOL
MARPRRAPVRTEAEITRDAIAELQAQMQTIAAALHNLNVQQQPPVRDNVERASNNDAEDDEEANLFAAAAAEHVNPFAPLNDRVLGQDNIRGAAAVVPWETGFKTEIPEFHGNSSAEELLDWIVTVEEILEFKRAPMERRIFLTPGDLKQHHDTFAAK